MGQKPKHVTWDSTVIDNEFMNKKKSNKCCIFHKPRRWDESDTEESDSSLDAHMHDKEKKNKMNIDQNNSNDSINSEKNQNSEQSLSNLTSNQAKSEKNENTRL